MAILDSYTPIGVRDPADTLIAFGYQQVRFLGAVSVAIASGQTQVTIGAGASINIEQAGVPIVASGTINFVSGATVVDNAGVADITITAPAPTVNSQVLAAGFTILSDAFYKRISSAGAVTSSAVTAIADGANDGQEIQLRNVGANDITLTQNANVQCPNGIDLTIGANDTARFIWDATSSTWSCTASSVN